MIALGVVHASNARLQELGQGLVGLFVGATSGIGEATAKAFVKHTVSPHVYIVGRSTTAAERIIEECKVLNKDAKVEFLKADVTELREVDRICQDIASRETQLNILVLSQGNLNLRGRDESPEGLDRKFALNFYSRMRFISNLLPQLRQATTTPPHFSRVLSVLGAGHEGTLDLDDLELKHSFSRSKCASHSTVMGDFMMEEFATREPAISFIHSFPGVVNTGAARELPGWLRIPLTVVSPLLSPLFTPLNETGERQLFIATSGLYPPANSAKQVETKSFAGGVPVPKGLAVMTGSAGKVGSGGYLVNWNGDITGKQGLLAKYRQNGVGQITWDHTNGIFERVKKMNEGRGL